MELANSMSAHPSPKNRDANATFIRQGRLCAIPPRIRAFVKVIHDIDRDQFPDVFTADGAINDSTVHALSVAVDCEVKTARDWEDLSIAFEDYARHLTGVDMASLERSGLGKLIMLSTSIDRESMFTNLSMAQDLSAVYAAHHILLRLVQQEFVSRQPDVLDLFINKIAGCLSSIEAIVGQLARSRGQRVGTGSSAARASSADSKNSTNPPVGDPQAAGDKEQQMLRSVVDLNSSLHYHVAHLAWFLTVSDVNDPPFDCRDVIDDVSALEVWCHHVGQSVPACSASTFLPALAAFPAWAHEPILHMLDFRGSGIISVFGIQRVLSLWGPFLLLDRNLSRDLMRNYINITETTAMVEARLRTQRPIVPGTTVMTVSSDHPAALDLLVVTKGGNVRKLLVDRSSGSWVLQGVSAEDYENPTDACVALQHIFSVPAGEIYAVPKLASADAAVNDTFSILHRACFRNNIAYVTKLIDRGGGVIANSAIIDPTITSQLSWTPLLAAVNNPNGDPAEVCKMLLASGADPMYNDQSTCTPLYYAIVNRYVKAAHILIHHCQHVSFEEAKTSAVTIPLFVALGAHFYNVSDLDNYRLEHCLPHIDTVKVLLSITTNLSVARAAYEVMYMKLNGVALVRRSTGEEVIVSYGSAPSRDAARGVGGCFGAGGVVQSVGGKPSAFAPAGPSSASTFASVLPNSPLFSKFQSPFTCPTLTDDEAAREAAAVARHTALCQTHSRECKDVLKLIGDHCYMLSARKLLEDVRTGR